MPPKINFSVVLRRSRALIVLVLFALIGAGLFAPGFGAVRPAAAVNCNLTTTRLRFVPDPPPNSVAGTTFSVTVQIQNNSNGTVNATCTNPVTLSFNNNPGGGVLSGTTTVSAVAGVATFSNLSINKIGIGYTLDADAPGFFPHTSQGFNITPGAPAKLAFNVQPSTTIAGATITPAVTVQIQDALGNLTTSTASVTVAIGTNPGGSTLSGTLTKTAVAGTATFNNLSLNNVGTGYTLAASASGLTGATSNTFNITGPSTKLVISVQPSNTVAGNNISPSVQVQIQDASGNVVNSNASVTIAIGTNPGGGTLFGTLTRIAVAGTATFNNLNINKAGTGYTLVVSSSGLTGATSNAFNITVGAPNQVTFVVQPSDTVAGAAIAPAIQVQIQDQAGNLVTTSSATVTISINGGGPTLFGTKVVNAVNGVATFNDLSIQVTGNYRLRATSPTLNSDTSNSFNIIAGAPTKLSFTRQPRNTAATVVINSTGFPSTVRVSILDQYDNVTTSNASVTVVIGANPGGGTLSGTTTVVASNGVASFSTLSINKAGNGYTLVASSGSLSGDTSSLFNITASVADHVSFSVQPSNTVAGTTISPAVKVEIRDAGDNLVNSNQNVTVGIQNNPGGGTLSGTLTVAAVNGVATFSNLNINKIGTGYTLVASSATLTTAISNAFNITPGTPAKLVFIQQPTNTPAATIISPAITVQILDALNNLTTSNANVTIAIGTNPGGGTLSGTLTVAAVNGTASFSNLSINANGVGYTLVVSSASLTGATSNLFNIAIGGPTKLGFGVQPSNTTAGVAIAPAITVRILDAGGNLTSSTANVTITINANPGGGTLSGTTTVAAVAGVATFSNLSIDKIGIGYTLDANSSGLDPATSNAFNITPAAATKLVFGVQPTDTVAGVAIAPAVTVRLLDQFDNLTTSTANVAIAIGNNPGGGTLSGTTPVAAVNGVATFSNLSINKIGTNYTLAASSTGLTGATSVAFDITPAAATKLVISVQPTDTVAGLAITPAFTVRLLDQFDNQTLSAANVTVAIGTNPGGGTLSGTTTSAASTGIASFNDLSINKIGTGYTLTVSSTGLTGATSNTFNITPAAAVRLALGVQPTDTVAGIAIAPVVTVRLLDQFDNLTTSTANVTVAIGTNPGGGTLSGTTTVAAVAGVATFSDLSINKVGIGYSLVAASGALASDTSNDFTITPAAPVKVVFSVQPTDTIAGVAISPAITIRLLDQFDNLTLSAANVTVAIETNPGGGTLSGTTTVAAVNGVATFSNLSIDKIGTGYTLAASSTGLTGATSNAFNITPAAPAKVVFGTQPTDTVAGVAISPAVTVRLLDQFDNQTASIVNVTVAIGTNPGGGTLSGTTTVAAVAGVATFNDLSINKIGTGYTLTASSGILTSANSTTFNITPAAAAQLAFSVQPTNTVAVTPISPAVQVQVLDAFGNLTTSTANVTVAIGTNPGSGTLSGTLSINAVAGTATFSNLSIDKVGTGYTLTAASGVLTGATSGTFNISVGPPTHLAFVVQPTNTVAGVAIAPAIIVHILDAGGNLTPSTAVITVTIGANPGSGTLSGTVNALAVNGVASYDIAANSTDLTINKTGIGYTLLAVSGSLTNATSNAFNITAGAPTQVAFNVSPTNTVAGVAIAPAVTVEIQDAFGNLTASTANVTVAIGTNPGSGTLSGTTTVAAVAGVATFNDLSINKIGTGYTLDATSTGLTGATSNSFNITPAAPAKVVFGTQPRNTVAGVAISPSVTVRILDQFDNQTTSTANVTVAIGTNPGGGTLSGTTTVAATAGTAAFSDLSINKIGIGYTLDATSSALTGDTSTAFDITPAAATHLTFGVQPTNTAAGLAISPAVTVALLDQFDNLTGSTANVTIAIGTNPSGGTLSGTTTVTAVAGTATFSNLSINKLGTGYTLDATSTGLTGATSTAFNITAGAAAKLVFGVQPTDAIAGVAISPAITVRILDAFDNQTTSTASVTIAIGTNPGGGTLTGTTPIAAVNGVATFNDLSINKIGTGYTLAASSGVLTGATSSAFNITPAAPTKVVFGQQPTNTIAGNAIAPAISVRILDQFDNLTSSTANVTIAIGTNPGGGTLSGTTTSPAVAGVATFSNLSIDKIGVGYTLTAASTGLTGGTSSAFNITPAGAAKLAFGVQPGTTVAGVAISPSVTVRILDTFGNLTTSTALVSIGIGTNPGGGTLSGTTPVVAVAGVATFSDLSINKIGVGYTLDATSASLVSATSNSFTIIPAAAAKLVFGVQPTNTVAAIAISPAVTVRLLDQFDNQTTSTANVTLAIGANPGSGTLSGTTTIAAVNGVATFSTLSIDKVGIGYTLTASSGVLTGATSTTFNITVGVPAKLAFGVQPTDTVAGATISPAITVNILDAGGNQTASTANVTIVIGANPGGGTLSGSTTVAAVGGIASFSNLSIDKIGTGYTLIASSGVLTGATSNTFNITSAPPTHLVFSVQPTNTVAATSISPAVKVQLLDAFNNLTSSTANVTIAIGTNPGGGTLSGTTTVAAVAGVATFNNLSIDKVGTGYTLSASSGVLTGATSTTFNITVGAPAKLAYGVQPTNTVAGVSIAPAITVRILDAGGNQTTSTANVAMAIGTNPGGGTLSGTTPVAAVAGVATFNDLSINKIGTGYTLATSSAGLTGATSSAFNITPAAAAKLAFAVQPTNTGAGVAISPAVTVQIQDAFGNLTSSTANVTVAIGANPGSGTLSGTTTAAAVAGTATFSTLSIDKVGTGYTLTAASTGLTGAISNTFNITSAAPTQLAIGAQPTNTVAGVSIAPAVTVRLLDQFGNQTGSTANVTIAIGTNPGGGTLSGTTTVAAVAGVATFSNLSIDKVGTGYTLTASSGILTGTTSTTFNITPAAAAKLAISVQPTNTVAGASISPAVKVNILDQFGNQTTSTANVSIAIGTNPGGGTLSGTTPVAAIAGVATFNNLSIDKIGTGYTLAASSAGLTGLTSITFNITASVPTQLVFGIQPSNTAAGAAISPAVTVRILDAFGNQTTSTANVTIAIGTNPGSGTLSGTTTVAAVNGVAMFSTLSIDKVGTGYTLTASSAGLTGATSTAFNITPALPAKLAFSVQPTNTVAVTSISPAITVKILDQFGNLTSSTANVTIAIGTNPGGGTLSGTTTVAAAAGVATFSNLSIDKVGTGYTLTAASGVLTGATSTAFNITVGAPANLAFGVQPTNTVAGVSIVPAVKVNILDAGGNQTASTANVTIAIGTNPGGGTLSGTTTVAAVNGVATFSNLSIDKIGTGYTLVASSGILTGAASTAFNITPAAPAKLAFGVQPTNTVAGVAITPAVKVNILDQFGNQTASTANVTVAIGTNPGGGTLAGTTTVAAVNGVATFSNLSIDKIGTGYTLVASSGALIGATSTAFNITPAAPAKLAFGVQPTNTVAGVSIAPAVKVNILDQFGNQTTSTANVTIAIGTNPGSGTLSGTTTVAAVNGVATFSNLSIDKIGTGYTLVASSGALIGATSTAFNITPAAPAKLAFGVQPTNTVAGVSIAPAVKVNILDQFGNQTTSAANVTIAIGTNPGSGTLSGTTTVAAVNGVATFSNLSIDKIGTGYTLAAASGVLTGATSSAFNITPAADNKLVITVQPTTTVAGVAIAPAVKVNILDQFGNQTVSTTNVTIAIGTNPGGGTLSGTTTVAAVNGAATFSTLSINKIGTGYTLVASSGALIGATSTAFNITPAAPAKVVFGTQPSNSVAGVAIAPAVTVRIVDAFDNQTASTANVTVAIGTNPGGGTLSGTTTVAAVNGVATFVDLSINKIGIGYTLTAASAGLTGAISNAFNITPATPSKVVFNVQPTTTQAGLSIAPPIKVNILDSFNNLTTSTANVTVAIGTNPGGGTLSGTTTVAAVAGTATFSNLSIDKIGTGYTLTAASGALTGATSTAFNITPAPAVKFVFVQQPTNIVAGAPFSPAVTLQALDQFGNLTLSTANVTLVIGTNPGGGTTLGVATVAAVNGLATFNNLSINKVGTGYTLVSISTGLTPVPSTAFNVTPGVATTLVVSGYPSPVIISTANNFTVTANDAYGNVATGYTGTIAFSSSDAAAMLPINYTFVAGDVGTHTFSATFKNAGTQTLTATDTSVASITGTQTITVNRAPTTTALITSKTPIRIGTSVTFTATVTTTIGALGTPTGSVTFLDGANILGATTLDGSGQAALTTTSLPGGARNITALYTGAANFAISSSPVLIETVYAPAKVVFIQQPNNSTPGVVISPAVTVQVQEADGNPVKLNDSLVTMSLYSGTGVLSGTLTQTTDVNGVATFNNLSINLPGYKALKAASAGLTPAISRTFRNGALSQPDTVGMYSGGVFYLRNSNSGGYADITVPFGFNSMSVYPVTGDWNNDDVDTIGVYNSDNGVFTLRDSNTPGSPDYAFVLGNKGDTPVSGRWDSGMTGDGVGVFRPSNGLLYLKRTLTSGFADYTMVLGNPGDVGIAGDWNGDGLDSIGVLRPANGMFYLSNAMAGTTGTPAVVFSNYNFAFGLPSELPFTGDWTATGSSRIGMMQSGMVSLRFTFTPGLPDVSFGFGFTGARPVAGHWMPGAVASASSNPISPTRRTPPTLPPSSILITSPVATVAPPTRTPVPQPDNSDGRFD